VIRRCILALALAGLCLSACGGARHHVPVASPTRATSGEAGGGLDSDNDTDSRGAHGYYDWDDSNILAYGHAAVAREAATIARTVKQYYAAAARADGRTACRLASSTLTRTIISQYSQALGFSRSSPKSCASVMSKLLHTLHAQLSDENATLKVSVARVEGPLGRVPLGIHGAPPKRYAQVRREHGSWKIESMLDYEVP
jgi:hypothetical protein